MTKKNLSEKELLFCHYLKEHRTPREAAALAGYLTPRIAGIKLAARPYIKEYIATLEENALHSGEVAEGLRRIAFGGIADVIRLIKAEDIGALDIESLDLHLISELKFPKSGGIEVKLYDRIRALEKLSEVSHDNGGESTLFEALQNSAKRIEETGE